MTAYYNEINPTAAQWLRNLIAGGHIAPGVVDERSIEDVIPDELREFTQCHFFAGVGVWSHALRLAGWPDNKPVWTGSCPCQPFSQAGKGAGFDDERHLWPAFFHLISECRPGVIFGEQVASKDGLAWIDLVQTDLEATGHACGAVDLCAAGLGAPHIRQRLFWVANSSGQRIFTQKYHIVDSAPYSIGRKAGQQRFWPDSWTSRPVIYGMANANGEQCKNSYQGPDQNNSSNGEGQTAQSTGFCSTGGLADSYSDRSQRRLFGGEDTKWEAVHRAIGCYGPDYRPLQVNGFWRAADWIWCRDGKWRPIESGVEPLANGAPCRMGRLRAYGNAINAEAARAFIASYMESQNDPL
ncbi:TPA: DNA cytosine methyltransferase [Enterobacter ludwigii]|nr:DNA cytosine methyltransferase [Enterobacter ludwigii]HDW3266549.1 DNA cytosine methyltransferase [Enterobacter ludwigii]